MKVTFSYPGVAPANAPEHNLMGIYRPNDVRPALPPDQRVPAALANPIGSPRLRDLAHRARRILVLVDDNTRPTPAHLILPYLLEELEAGTGRRSRS